MIAARLLMSTSAAPYVVDDIGGHVEHGCPVHYCCVMCPACDYAHQVVGVWLDNPHRFEQHDTLCKKCRAKVATH